MNQRLIDLALKRQRLQLQAATQRLRIVHALQSAAPAFGAAEKVRAALGWARAHPEWLAGIGIAVLVARPRAFFRWARRGFFAWQTVRRARAALDTLLPDRQA